MVGSRESRRVGFSRVGGLLAVVFLALIPLAMHQTSASSKLNPQAPQARARTRRDFTRLPLAFEPNRGQAAPEANFIAHGGGFEAFLDSTGATLAIGMPQIHTLPSAKPGPSQLSLVRMNLVGASNSARAQAQDRLPGVMNYYRGSDRTKWRREVPTYRHVRYAEVYRGIDLAYYGDRGSIEFDFDLKPHADAKQIALAFDGVETADISADGGVQLKTARGNVMLKRPLAYQDKDGARRAVVADYRIDRRAHSTQVTIALGDFDHSQALTIDPIILFSTFFGGTTTEINGAALDASGNVYVTGFAFDCMTCAHFPTTGGQTFAGDVDAFVSKISADGSTLDYSTLIGGTNFDQGKALAVDGGGNAYLTGVTFSTDFPRTVGPASAPANGDGFVAKFSGSGAVTWATYLGGGEFDEPFALAIEQGCASNCNAYVAGQTQSSDFPAASGFTGQNDAFVAEMMSDGSGVVQTTLIAGNSGATGVNSGITFATALAVDSSGIAFVAGGTDATDFPKTEGPGITGATDAWVAKLNANGSVSYARLLGGSDFDQAEAIAIPPACTEPCNAYLEGVTFSSDFPTHAGLGTSLMSSAAEFVTELSGDGSSTVYSTLLSVSDAPLFGALNGLAIDSSGDAFVIGNSASGAFPLQGQVGSFPGPNGALWQFAEGGSSATPTPTPAPNKLSWASANGSPLVIQEGTSETLISTTTGIFRSTDGTSFSRLSATGLPAGAVPALQLEEGLSPAVIFAGTASGLFVSTDIGATFVATSFTKPVQVVVDIPGASLSNTDVLVGTVGNGGWSSTSGGASFTQVASLPTTATIFSLASNSNGGSPGEVFVGTSRGVYVSANVINSFPGTWTASNLSMSAVPAVATDRKSTPPVAYAGTYFQGLYESTDNFTTFVRANIPQFSYSAVDVDRDNSSTPATVFAGVNAIEEGFVYENTTGYGGAFTATNFANEAGSVKGLKNPYVGQLLQFHPVVAELNPNATTATFSSYLGGSSYDEAGGLAVDPTGTNIYLAGTTYSADFPHTGVAISAYHGFASGFVTKLGPPPGATATLTPTATATSGATATATATASATPMPSPGKIVAAPARLTLRPVGIGAAGANSTAKLTIRNIAKNGELAGNISIVNSQPGNAFTLSAPGAFDIPARGAPLTETVTFVPDALSDGATITITSNDPSKGTINIAVTGKGLGGRLVASPRTLVFVSPGVGQAVQKSFTLRNLGKGVLMGSVSNSTDPFTGAGGSGTIQPGQSSGPINVTFTPTSTTPITQVLQVTAQPPSTGSTTVTLKGSVKK